MKRFVLLQQIQISLPFLMAALVLGMILPVSAAWTTLDITRPVDGQHFQLAAPGMANAAVTRQAIQQRLDYLMDVNFGGGNRGGEVYLPQGDWYIDKPLIMSGDEGIRLVGAGRYLDAHTGTRLSAKDGVTGMQMIQLGYLPNNLHNEGRGCQRELTTDIRQELSGAGMAVAPGTKWGLRTLVQYPPTNGTTVRDVRTDPKRLNPLQWQAAANYKPGDWVQKDGYPYYCRVHPDAGVIPGAWNSHWSDYWTMVYPFEGLFLASPLSAGSYNAATGRATDWGAGQGNFTLDLAYTKNFHGWTANNECAIILGVGQPLEQDSSPVPQCTWWLQLDGERDGCLKFYWRDQSGGEHHLVLCDAKQNPQNAGLYKITIQMDFPNGKIRGWTTLPNGSGLPVASSASLSGASMYAIEQGALSFNAGVHSPQVHHAINCPPDDFTLCGLHMSNANRYADADILTPNGWKLNDNNRFFLNDVSTMASLPLTDHPTAMDNVLEPSGDLKHYGDLVTVQHGAAAGDATQQSFGYLMPLKFSYFQTQ